jgi:hypothetical protein
MLSKNARPLSARLVSLLSSRRFYGFVLGLFIFESAWIAFSAIYPQAFDEDFHFGLIRLYSHHWLPFLSGQPAGADVYGAVARDPSYFYHYLMSFPYRLLALFIHGQTGLVIAMRLIDVGLFATGLALFRRVLLRVGLSRSLANVSLLLFILIPIVPQLAAQVNYDDLLFPLTAWVCLQAFQLTDELKSRQPTVRTIFKLAITAILTSIVKYAFLPIVIALGLYFLVIIYKLYRHNLVSLWRSLVSDFRAQSRQLKIILPLLLLISSGLFLQRAGYNLVRYHSFVPNCSTVLSIKQCSAYSPWYTDYTRHQQLLAGRSVITDNLFSYTGLWFYWMWYRLFFAINGVASGFYSNPPLPLPGFAAIVIGGISALAVIKWRARLFHNNPYLLFLLTICVVYSASLFAKGYATYKYTAYLENMNGRYLLPILLPLAAIAGLALSQALRRSLTQKVLAVAVVLVLFLEGGGLLTFIVRSGDGWYWPNSTVVKVNKTANKIANHVVVKNVKRQ